MGPQILVVEDNEKNRVLVKDVLTYFGYDVLEATDGLEGIAMAREHRPGLILMDLQMPVLSGLDAMKQLKEHPETKGIRIIAVTSFAMKGDREKLLDAGFDGYIAKPLDPIELPEIVKKYLS